MEKIGNIKREKVVFKSRVIFSAIIMLSITLILIVKLFNLQVTKHDYYLEEALGNQMQNLPITPIRGDILDRNGKILATNEFSYILTITPEKVTNLNETLIGLEIRDLITYDDIKKFNKKLRKIALEIFDSLNMKTIYMDPKSHDVHVAYVSHLSHISSFMLGKTVIEKEENENNIFDLAGSGFESTVRLAKSRPETWTPIFLQNKGNLVLAIEEYISNLSLIKELILSLIHI